MYEKQLANNDYLVGNKYSIADICTEPWIRSHNWAGVSLDEFPKLQAWIDRIEARPGFQAGLKIPEQDSLTKMREDPAHAEKAAKEASKWVSRSLRCSEMSRRGRFDR